MRLTVQGNTDGRAVAALSAVVPFPGIIPCPHIPFVYTIQFIHVQYVAMPLVTPWSGVDPPRRVRARGLWVVNGPTVRRWTVRRCDGITHTWLSEAQTSRPSSAAWGHAVYIWLRPYCHWNP